MMNVHDQIEHAKELARRKDQESKAKFQEDIRRIEEERAQITRLIREYTRPATSYDYSMWLTGYLENGGQITHQSGDNTPNDFRVAIKDIPEPIKAYGAMSFSLIVPVGITVAFTPGHMPWGHVDIYWLDGYRCHGDIVPCYADTKAMR